MKAAIHYLYTFALGRDPFPTPLITAIKSVHFTHSLLSALKRLMNNSVCAPGRTNDATCYAVKDNLFAHTITEAAEDSRRKRAQLRQKRKNRCNSSILFHSPTTFFSILFPYRNGHVPFWCPVPSDEMI